MRELEFRAWWKDTKRFLDCDEWYMTCSGAKYLHYAVSRIKMIIPLSSNTQVLKTRMAKRYTRIANLMGDI